MQVLAILNLADGKTPEDLAPHAKAEAEAAWALTKEGVFRSLQLRTDRPGAIALLEVATIEDAQKAIARLPFVELGLLSTEIIPLSPYTGYEALFA